MKNNVTLFNKIVNAYETSTRKNNSFEKFCFENAESITKADGNYSITFNEDVSIETDSLNPFEMTYCEYFAWGDDYENTFSKNLCK